VFLQGGQKCEKGKEKIVEAWKKKEKRRWGGESASREVPKKRKVDFIGYL